MDHHQDGTMSDALASARSGWLRALWGGLLSLIWPGLGQIYAGWWRLGIGLYIAAAALDLFFLGLTWSVPPASAVVAAAGGTFLIFRLVIAADAFRRVRARQAAMPRSWYRSTWFAAIVMIAISLGTGLSDMGFSPGWRSFHVASASNLPTLSASDYVLVDVRHPGTLPNYGDVVVFRNPRDPKVDYIKRVVALPGDRVQVRDGVLSLNGKPAPRESQGIAGPFNGAPRGSTFQQYRETLPNGRSYMIVESSSRPPGNADDVTVPPGSFFVLGDNRNDSLDSRFFGYVPAANVVGLVDTIYWSNEPARFLSHVR
jgi:signal peptidase I